MKTPFLLLTLFLATLGPHGSVAAPARLWQDEIVYVIVNQKFYNGDTNNDFMARRFGAAREKYEGGFWGGDLAGISRQLDYIKGLGVTAILLYPILQNDANPYWRFLATGYRPTDYFKIDPNFGDEAAFRKLVADAHARRLKVIVDMPLGMPGQENPIARDPAKKDWLGAWTPYGLRQWNATNPVVANYLISVCKYWISHSGCDGFRMDSSHMHSVEFWRHCNQEIRGAAAGHDPILIGELPLDPVKIGQFVKDGGFSSGYDFSFTTVRSVLGKSGNAGELGYELAEAQKAYQYPARMLAQVDAYEDPTFVDFAEDPKTPRMLAAMTCLLTIDRVPVLYTGDECAMAYRKVGELFEKRTAEQIAFRERVKQLIALRRREPALRRGTFTLVPAGEHVCAYVRQTTGPARQVLVAINCTGERRTVRPAVPGQDWKSLKLRDLLSGRNRKDAGSDATLNLEPFEAVVLGMGDSKK